MEKIEVTDAKIGRTVNALLRTGARRATAYLSPTLTVKATIKAYGGRVDRRDRSRDVVLTIGRPNFREAKFVRKLKLAGEPFPVRKIQLEFPKGKRA